MRRRHRLPVNDASCLRNNTESISWQTCTLVKRRRKDSPKTKVTVTELRHYLKIAMQEVAWTTRAPKGYCMWMISNVLRIHARVVNTRHKRHTLEHDQKSHSNKITNSSRMEEKESCQTHGVVHGMPASNVTRARRPRSATTRISQGAQTRNDQQRLAEVCKCWTRGARHLYARDEFDQLDVSRPRPVGDGI